MMAPNLDSTVRSALLLAVLLTAGCVGPSPASFADALGEPGCRLRLPDGSDALCHPSEQSLTPQAGPPSVEWVCMGEIREPSMGVWYAIYRNVLTEEHALGFEDRRLSPHPTGVLLDTRRPDYVGKWSGPNPAFIPLGLSLSQGDGDSLTIRVYDFRTAAEGEATRAIVHERWNAVEGDAWLSYQVSFDDETYFIRGTSADILRHELVTFPKPLLVENGAGKLTGDFTWNGGVAFGGAGGLVPDEDCVYGV